MSSGKIVAMVLEADGAITKWRDAMGATDPKKAALEPFGMIWVRVLGIIAVMAQMPRTRRRLKLGIFLRGMN